MSEHLYVFEGNDLTVIQDDEDLWFRASEVCTVLGFANQSQAVSTHVDEDDLQKMEVIDSLGRKQQANHINESGLYALTFGSTLDAAKRFKRWVTKDVLPAIRKTGKFQAPSVELSRMDILKLAMESEEGRIKAEAERDHAIATKAQIGSKREATAMANVAKANREVSRLMDRLGFNTKHATVKAVEGATKRTFGPQGWRPLSEWCKTHGVSAVSVPDPLYGSVKSWPADAWGEIYGVDLSDLFSEKESA